MKILGSVRFWAMLNGAIVVALVGAALFSENGVLRHERLDEELARVNLLNDDLAVENDRLRREVNALRHDPEYVETVIRDELGWVREDETVFLFAPTEEEQRAKARAKGTPPKAEAPKPEAAKPEAPRPEAAAEPKPEAPARLEVQPTPKPAKKRKAH